MSSGFVTETELEEKRKIRQEEWEKVRQPDQPIEAPEEIFDHRSLFDRLEEQKQKKQMEYEEAHKLKNMIKGLDDDEVDFLDFVDRKKIENEQMKEREEKQELLEFRRNVEKLKESSLEERIQAEIRPPKVNNQANSGSRSQHKLLKGVVVKRKAEETQQDSNKGEAPVPKRNNSTTISPSKESDEGGKRKRIDGENEECVAGLTCVGILPGLGSYGASSDSDSDSSCCSGGQCHSHPKYDLLGRKLVEQIVKEKKQESGHVQ